MLLVAGALFFELLQLEMSVVELFLQSVALIGLLGDVPLSGEDLSLASVDLLSGGGNLPLDVVVVTVLLIQQEPGVVNLLPDHVETRGIGVVSLLEVVVHEQLFILEVAVLGLDGVQLVAEGQVVLVTLLDLEDLGLQLRNQQVLLVGGEVHAIVVLQKSDSKRNLLLTFFDC